MQEKDMADNDENFKKQLVQKTPMQQRMAQKNRFAKGVNKKNNDHLKGKLIEELKLNLYHLETYAIDLEVPENVPLPPSIPLQITHNNIRQPSIRSYFIRKHIQAAEDILFEVSELPEGQFHSYHRQKLKQRLDSVRRLVSFLKTVNS